MLAIYNKSHIKIVLQFSSPFEVLDHTLFVCICLVGSVDMTVDMNPNTYCAPLILFMCISKKQVYSQFPVWHTSIIYSANMGQWNYDSAASAAFFK